MRSDSFKTVPLEFAEELIFEVASNKSGRSVSNLCRPEFWQEAAERLAVLNRIVVISGFFVPSAGAPETDGPGGAAILARAFLEQGADAEIWTDAYCVDALNACASSIGFPSNRVKVFEDSEILSTFSPEAIIFTERLGRASDGKYYNILKNNISHWTPPLDELAVTCAKKGIMTVGIGDGGNEVGMGNFISELSEMLPDYKECLSVVRTDVAIPVDVSNWGSYALTAALSHVWGEWRGHREGEERAMLAALNKFSAVDGISKKSESSVDGFPISVHESLVSDLYDLWHKFNC